MMGWNKSVGITAVTAALLVSGCAGLDLGAKKSNWQAEVEASARRDDQELPLAFGDLFSRPSVGVPLINPQLNWRAFGDEAIKIVSQHAYSDIKAAMKALPPNAVIGMRPGNITEFLAAIRNKNECARFAGTIECVKDNAAMADRIEREAGGSVFAKYIAVSEHIKVVGPTDRIVGMSQIATLKYRSTKRAIAVGVLLRAYDDANGADAVSSRFSIEADYRDAIDQPKLFGVQRNPGASGTTVVKYLADSIPTFWAQDASRGTHQDPLTFRFSQWQGMDAFTAFACRSIPFDGAIRSQLFLSNDVLFGTFEKTRSADAKTMLGRSNRTFFTDPFNKGLSNYAVLLATRDEAGAPGSNLLGDSAERCKKALTDVLRETDEWQRSLWIGTQRMAPVSRNVVNLTKLKTAEVVSNPTEPDTFLALNRLKLNVAAATSYIQSELERMEGVRRATKLR